MNEKEVLERLKSLIADYSPAEEDEITLVSSLYDDLDLDSLDVAQLSIDIDREFSVSLDDTNIDAWKTVDDIVQSLLIIL